MRPVMMKGGVVADQVGYGKTAITLGIIVINTLVLAFTLLQQD